MQCCMVSCWSLVPLMVSRLVDNSLLNIKSKSSDTVGLTVQYCTLHAN